MTRFRYENKFSNARVDACWLSRAGKQDLAKELLGQKYSNLSPQEIDEAINAGASLNMTLWELSYQRWNKEIEKEDFLTSVRDICPDLTDEMLQHLYDTAMFDSK